jgi:hypothetical protein
MSATVAPRKTDQLLVKTPAMLETSAGRREGSGVGISLYLLIVQMRGRGRAKP